MSQWGRGPAGASGFVAMPAPRLARRSLLCAVVAYVVAAAAFVVAFRMPGDLPLPWPTLAPLALWLLFAVLVPIIHVIGIVYGARALSRPDESRGIAVLGIVLNLLSIGGVLLALWAVFGNSVG